MDKLSIAFLSGKGGTGKTFISTNFANSVPNASYIDTDVEEPNGSIFFPTENKTTENVSVKIPQFDREKCTGCRACVDFCKYNALIFIKRPFLVPEVCHSCEGCYHVCNYGAIKLVDKKVGEVEKSLCRGHEIISGKMKVGEMSGTPVIKCAKETSTKDLIAIDCPPGSSCLVLEAIHDVDYCVLVVESTLFGFHNFKMVYNICKKLNKPIGIVINKYDGENSLIKDFAAKYNVKILDIFPFDRDIAEKTSAGNLISNNPLYASRFKIMYKKILHQLHLGEQNE
ncbi:MAG: 4Fe-4S binding protein [Bacilli bacterium]